MLKCDLQLATFLDSTGNTYCGLLKLMAFLEPADSVNRLKTKIDNFWPTVLSVAPLAHCVVCLSSVTFCILAKRCILE